MNTLSVELNDLLHASVDAISPCEPNLFTCDCVAHWCRDYQGDGSWPDFRQYFAVRAQEEHGRVYNVRFVREIWEQREVLAHYEISGNGKTTQTTDAH